MRSTSRVCQLLATTRRTWRPLPTNHTQSRCLNLDTRFVKVSREVQKALDERRPVVALETTIYTHGLPYPENIELASRLEAIVRDQGAVPAHIGISAGRAHVGLTAESLTNLALAAHNGDDVLKVSRRDLGFALRRPAGRLKCYNGGTTVAGTMILANLAGIKVLATGGLGGVHRGAQDTFDISADLTELGRTPVAVVASGCKAFLDIAKTLEYLETQGVCVATFADGREGQVDFPAFWSRDSGCVSPMTITDEREAARIMIAQAKLQLQSGVLFANPIPARFEIPFAEIQRVVNEALEEAGQKGATGNRATPFILAKIMELTAGQSVVTNKALVESNVKTGAKIAIELSLLERRQQLHRQGRRRSSVLGQDRDVEDTVQQADQSSMQDTDPFSTETPADVFVAGMLAVDYAGDYSPRDGALDKKFELQTSNPAQISQGLGGVGHNVARAVQLAGADVRLCSAVGDDINGKAALEAMTDEDMDVSGIATLPKSSGRRTAQYVAVNDGNKDLVVAVADMRILDDSGHSRKDVITETLNDFWLPQLQSVCPSHLVIDANWAPRYLKDWLYAGREIKTHITFEPVSNAKATGIFELPGPDKRSDPWTLSVYPETSIHLTTPNQHELSSMYDAARERKVLERSGWWRVIDAFGIPSSGARVPMVQASSAELVDQGIPQKSIQLLPFLPCITTKLGSQGVLLTQIIPADDPRLNSSDYAPYIISRCTNGTENEIKVGGVYMRLFPPAEVVRGSEVVSVNGVGDTFAGVLVANLAKMRKEGRKEYVEDAIELCQRASVMTLKSKEAVSPEVASLARPVDT